MDPLAQKNGLASGPQSLRQLWSGGMLLAASEESVNQNPSSVSVCSFVLGTGGAGSLQQGKCKPLCPLIMDPSLPYND